MSKVIVSGIMDVNMRGGYSKRNAFVYASLLSYLLTLDYKVIVFIEQHLQHLLPKHDNLIVYIKAMEDLPSWNLIPKDGKVIYPEANIPKYWLYSVANNAKVYLVQEAMKLEPNYDLYVWLDAGMRHGDPCDVELARKSIESIELNKITFGVLSFPLVTEHSIDEFWKSSQSTINGNIMAFPKQCMEAFVSDYEAVLKLAHYKNLTLNEEQILPVVCCKQWDKYNYRFTDYKGLTQLRWISRTEDQERALKNLEVTDGYVFLQLLNQIIDSIKHGYMRIYGYSVANLLYYGHYKSYYVNRQISDRFARIIKLLLTHGSEFMPSSHLMNYLRQFNNLEANIAYNNVTIPNTYQEYFKLYPEDLDFLVTSL